MNTTDYINLSEKVLTPNYGPRETIMVRGEKEFIWDSEGNKYLDFLSGIAVVNLGHCHPKVTEAICKQAQLLPHCSNYFLVQSQIELASLLCEHSFAGKAFFCNSGAEANEAAIKIARRYSVLTTNRTDRFEIITMKNSFHGRTIATASATGQEKIQKTFEPLLEGFRYATYNDIKSVESLVSDKTCAIMLEPIQGEGGVIPATKEFMIQLRELCDRKKILLIFDEVQCGMGRSGKLFAHEHFGVTPDIMSLAKALANGFPIGAMLSRTEIGEVLTKGSHGTTFGGNPMACAAGVAVMKAIYDEDILQNATEKSDYLRDGLSKSLSGNKHVSQITGIGMILGIHLDKTGFGIVHDCAKHGLIINCTANTVIRLLPPLIATFEDCDYAIEMITKAINTESNFE